MKASTTLDIWIGSETHRKAVAQEFQSFADLDIRGYDATARFVIEAYAGPGKPTDYGLDRLAYIRRRSSNTNGVLVYSFESRATLSRRFSIMSKDVPGITFLQAPFSAETFQNKLKTLKPMTDDELAYVQRWYCGLQEDWRRISHDLGHTLSDWPSQRAKSEALLASVNEDIRNLAPDLREQLKILTLAMDASEHDVRVAMQALDDGLCQQAPLPPLPEAPCHRPPEWFDSIAIGDDNGYEPATIHRLRQLGYLVYLPATALDQALVQLELASPRVVLADRNFPSAEEGKTYMEAALARDWVRLVIAISRSGVVPGSLPDGVEDCTGANRFQDADYIHRLIWQRARAEGIDNHV